MSKEYVPIFSTRYLLSGGDPKAELEGWAEVVERDPQRGNTPYDGSMNPFVFGYVRFLADPPEVLRGRLFRFADIRLSPPRLGHTGFCCGYCFEPPEFPTYVGSDGQEHGEYWGG